MKPSLRVLSALLAATAAAPAHAAPTPQPIAAPVAIAGPSPAAARSPMSPASASRLSRARAYLQTIGASDLASLGTIDLRDATIEPGLHALRPRCGVRAGTFAARCSNLTGSLPRAGAAPGLGAGGGAVGNVTIFTGAELSDVALVMADTVVFDDATLRLREGVSELWIVANTVVSDANSRITWTRRAQADGIASHPECGADGHGYDRYSTTRIQPDEARDGRDGADGANGRRGNDGRAAPHVFVYVDTLTARDDEPALPRIEVEGEVGGTGQRGQCAGDGGHGEEGSRAVGHLWCVHRPGVGGDGGAGGDVEIHFVRAPEDLTYSSAAFATDGGRGGSGGEVGVAGRRGLGGSEGDRVFPCAEQPNYDGDDGRDGRDGVRGANGNAGADGDVVWADIAPETWEAAFTAPYIVSADAGGVPVGEPVFFQTRNVTGGARLTLVDEVDTTVHARDLVAAGADRYRLETDDLPAGRYTVRLMREHDDRPSNNTYRIELLPVIEQVAFTDPFDARPGGSALVVGRGLREDAEIVFDGQNLGRGTPEGGGLRFTLPVVATDGERFVRDDGVTPHALWLDQPYPLADSVEVAVRLKRSAGLTFRASTHGFSFSNGALSAVARQDALDRPWTYFRQTYGFEEVDLYTASLVFAPLVGLVHAGWLAWWSNPSSALCTGISSTVLEDYFAGVTGLPQVVEEDVAHRVMLTQGRLLSREILGAMLHETFEASFTDAGAVDQVVDFFTHGGDEDGGDAPVLVMLPSLASYLGAIEAMLDSQDEVTVREAVEGVVDMISNSHSLAPYMAVWAHPGDARPSRIYVYDSNVHAGRSSADEQYVEVLSLGGGVVGFDFDGSQGTADGWSLGALTVEFLHREVSLPLVPF